jgi:hypothetical protein
MKTEQHDASGHESTIERTASRGICAAGGRKSAGVLIAELSPVGPACLVSSEIRRMCTQSETMTDQPQVL